MRRKKAAAHIGRRPWLHSLFDITLQFLIKIFARSGKDHNDKMPVFFINAIGNFVIRAVVKNIKAIDPCKISGLGFSNIGICLNGLQGFAKSAL